MADDDLLKEFLDDTQSHLEAIEDDVLRLENDFSNRELIDDIFRRVHSIKGNAGMLGFSDIHENGQEFETFLDGVRERGSSAPEEVEAIFNSLDSLKSVVGDLREQKGFGREPAPAAEETVAAAPPPEPERRETEAVPPLPEPLAPSGEAPVKNHAVPGKAEAAAGRKEGNKITFLTFDLAGEKYGVDIMKVREIITTGTITRVPNTKSFVEGVMNLRDQVIPVFNLKARLDVDTSAQEDQSEEKNIIIVEISKLATGLKVDEVTGIKMFDTSRISSPDAFYGSIPSDYLYGIGQAEEGAVILLETNDLCDPSELLY